MRFEKRSGTRIFGSSFLIVIRGGESDGCMQGGIESNENHEVGEAGLVRLEVTREGCS